MRKQSFYVWFLGAQEARGTRDDRYVRPVLKYLLNREKDVEPTKVTLQVSSKGLKIVQNIVCSKSTKKETMKHLVPPHALTWVMQAEPPHEDIVCCTLLIYNPVAKCPVQVHAYRCDSVETAASLRLQLSQLMTETQRSADPASSDTAVPPLQGNMRGPLHSASAAAASQKQLLIMGSDGRSTRTDEDDLDFERDIDCCEVGKRYTSKDSDISNTSNDTYRRYSLPNSDDDYGGAPSRPILTTPSGASKNMTTPPPPPPPPPPHDPRMARLYSSLAQELKAKLAAAAATAAAGSNDSKCNAQKAPLLLPPRDYDTMCRKQGNLMGIDFRRSTNQNIVGRPSTAIHNSLPPTMKHRNKSPSRGREAGPRLLVENGLDQCRRESERNVLQRGEHLFRPSAESSAAFDREEDGAEYPGKTSCGIASDEIPPVRAPSQLTDRMIPNRLPPSPRGYHEVHAASELSRSILSPPAPQHRSLDFLQQRLDHFRVGDRKRTTSASRGSHDTTTQSSSTSSKVKEPSHVQSNGAAPFLAAARSPPPPPESPSTDGSYSLQLGSYGGAPSRCSSTRHQEGFSRMIAVKRNIAAFSPAERFTSFHQHPVKESMIEPVINQRQQQQQKGRSNPFQDRRLEPKFIPSQPMMGFSSPEPHIMRPHSGRQATDFRRQSLAEFREGSQADRRLPVSKYCSNNNMAESRRAGCRYSVAESERHRFY